MDTPSQSALTEYHNPSYALWAAIYLDIIPWQPITGLMPPEHLELGRPEMGLCGLKATLHGSNTNGTFRGKLRFMPWSEITRERPLAQVANG